MNLGNGKVGVRGDAKCSDGTSGRLKGTVACLPVTSLHGNPACDQNHLRETAEFKDLGAECPVKTE